MFAIIVFGFRVVLYSGVFVSTISILYRSWYSVFLPFYTTVCYSKMVVHQYIIDLSKSTGGEEPVEDIPIFTCKHVCLYGAF